jgi:hypothetical protein
MKVNEKFYSNLDTLKVADIPQDWWLERYRNWRAIELQSSDWTQLSDSPATASDWATYRQALRDLPAVADFANAEVPQAPAALDVSADEIAAL